MKKKWVGCGLIAIALGMGLAGLAIEAHYIQTSTQSPRPETGEIILLDWHGTRVFLSALQQYLLWSLQFGALIVGGVGCLLLRDRENNWSAMADRQILRNPTYSPPILYLRAAALLIMIAGTVMVIWLVIRNRGSL